MNTSGLYILNLSFVIILICDKVHTFEPISVGLTAGVASGFLGTGFYYLKNPIRKYTICQFTECCNEDYILKNVIKLKNELYEKLYGQHIALEIVPNSLAAHWKEKQPQKALTLSFHGMPGSGKNYVTQFIQNAFYKKSAKSAFVHYFNGRIHFPMVEKSDEYKSFLQNWIKGNVSDCKHSLFIFDEVDKMPPTVLNAIKPMIDYHEQVDKVDYRNAVFIFLSNTGSGVIRDHLLYLWKQGIRRQDIGLKDFEPLITKGAFNEKGGFHHSDTIKSNLIDHYIPFLPMQYEHVEMCIRDQFKIRDINSPDRKLIEEILTFVEWGPAPENLFSTTGCKRISQKVALIIEKYKLYDRDNDDL